MCLFPSFLLCITHLTPDQILRKVQAAKGRTYGRFCHKNVSLLTFFVDVFGAVCHEGMTFLRILSTDRPALPSAQEMAWRIATITVTGTGIAAARAGIFRAWEVDTGRMGFHLFVQAARERAHAARQPTDAEPRENPPDEPPAEADAPDPFIGAAVRRRKREATGIFPAPTTTTTTTAATTTTTTTTATTTARQRKKTQTMTTWREAIQIIEAAKDGDGGPHDVRSHPASVGERQERRREPASREPPGPSDFH